MAIIWNTTVKCRSQHCDHYIFLCFMVAENTRNCKHKENCCTEVNTLFLHKGIYSSHCTYPYLAQFTIPILWI